MTDRVVRACLVLGVAVLSAVTVTVALTDAHLIDAPALLVASTLTAAAAVAGLAVQPWLARRPGLHAAVGGLVVALVAVHVGALVVLEPDDALFAMSPAGPTRARAALLGTLALLAVAGLGLLRRRLRWRRATFRFLHAGLGASAVVLGIAHATLTAGALDGTGTAVLLTLGAVGLLGGLRGMLTRAATPASEPDRATPIATDGRTDTQAARNGGAPS